MKFLLIVASLLAVSSAGWVVPYAQHIPVIHNGVPVETPEVQLAKANHYAAHVAARTGVVAPVHVAAQIYAPAHAVAAGPLDTPEVAAAKIQHYHDYAVAAQRNGVAVAPVLTHPLVAGVHPIDTPEVQLAKSAHFAAHAEAHARNALHLRKRRSAVPVDTPEVQAAKAAHLAAHAAARAGIPAAPIAIYGYNPWVPHATIGPNGHPVETPEVQLLKSAHYAAHAEAAARNGVWSPLVYAAPWAHGAVIGHDGHPVDTPEVQAAKAAHLAAHAQARAGHW